MTGEWVRTIYPREDTRAVLSSQERDIIAQGKKTDYSKHTQSVSTNDESGTGKGKGPTILPKPNLQTSRAPATLVKGSSSKRLEYEDSSNMLD